MQVSAPLQSLPQRIRLHQLAWLALAATLVTAGLITYGAWVRVSSSGLGCPNWPLCTDASNNGKAALIESGHRVMATLDVVLVYFAALIAFLKRREARSAARFLYVAAALIVAQAVLGGVTVILELPGFVRLAHLSLALTVLATLAVATTLLFSPMSDRTSDRTSLAISPKLLVFLTIATVLVGGSIVATQTSFDCLSLPFCESSAPRMAGALHAAHRLLGLILGLVIVAVVLTLRTAGPNLPLRRVGLILCGLVAMQLFLGVAAIELSFPGALRILHLGLAACIWWAMVTFIVLAVPAKHAADA